MTSEQHRWTQMREEAQGYLPADFSKQVVRRAQSDKETARREYVLIAATAAFCLMSVAVTNWYVGNMVQKRNLTEWGVAASQVGALRRSI
jgi:hypothetical protein